MHAAIALFIDDRQWTAGWTRDDQPIVETIDRDAEATVEQTVAALREKLAARGIAAASVVLALPSSRCLSAVIATDDLERGNRRRAMTFRLEEHLPVAAEQITADYVEAGSTALGVCVETEPLRPIVEALENEGLAVHHIVPAAMLAAMAVTSGDRDADAALLIGRGDDASTDLIELAAGEPTRWHWLAGAGDELRIALQTLAAQADGRARLSVVGEGPARGAIDPDAFDLADHDGSVVEAAIASAGQLIDGKQSPWVDLRRDALARPDRYETYRKPALALGAALALMLAAIIGVTQWRAGQYAAIQADLAGREVELFKQTFPDQRVPVNIESRLASEARKLAGLSGQDAGDLASMRPTSALVHLYALLAALPGDLRFRILDLSIDPDQLRVTGEARAHGDAERIASSLRDTGRYEVDPPRTEALADRGVSFTFTARPLAEADLAKAGRR